MESGQPAPERPSGGRAAEIVTQRVDPAEAPAFREWQEGVNREVAAFEGFLGTEVTAPPGGGDEWTVIHHFRSRDALQAWLASAQRAGAAEQAGELFAAPPSHQVVVGGTRSGGDPVTVVVTHPVDPAQEEEFRSWVDRLTEAERAVPGYLGSELLRPVPGVQDDWTTIFRYDSEENLETWLESPARKRLLEEGRQFSEFELKRISGPFGAWFSTGGEGDQAGEAPAQWKTALAVLVGLYPTVVLLTLAIEELWKDGPLWATLLVGNIASVSLLTWVVMPVVNHALGFWLTPGDQDRPRTELIGTALAIGFLTFAAILFWLTTTQIWDLP